MTQLLEPMLTELREEAAITKRVLDRVPADKLSWRPHPKSLMDKLSTRVFKKSGVVHARVTSCTNGNQVLFGIITTLTPKLFVVNFQVRSAPAALTSPTVAA
jgi:hypothetical protein